jgi:hypothetical protein
MDDPENTTTLLLQQWISSFHIIYAYIEGCWQCAIIMASLVYHKDRGKAVVVNYLKYLVKNLKN